MHSIAIEVRSRLFGGPPTVVPLTGDGVQGATVLTLSMTTPNVICSSVITRKILHLSDLHIGLNGSEKNSNALKRIVVKIIKCYENDQPKPLIIITGDIADYGNGPSNCIAEAKSLLQPLTNAGFKVLPIPGNHDYSGVSNSNSIGGNDNYAKYIKPNIEKEADKHHSRKDMLTGSQIDEIAVKNYANNMGCFLTGWAPGHAWSYDEEWQGKFKLRFVLIDGQDLGTSQPYLAKWADISPSFFTHDGRARFAHGYINPTQIGELEHMANVPENTLIIACVHYWIDYGIPDLDPDLSLVQLVYNELLKPNTYNPTFLRELFRLSIEIGLIPEDNLRLLINAVSENISYLPAKFTYESLTSCNSPDYVNYQESHSHRGNPNFDVSLAIDYTHVFDKYWYIPPPILAQLNAYKAIPWGTEQTHDITNVNEIDQFLGDCHLLLVGHRHEATGLQDLKQLLKQEINNLKIKYQGSLPKFNANDIRIFFGPIKEFEFSKQPSPSIDFARNQFVEALAYLVDNFNSGKYFDEHNVPVPSMLQYINESGTSTDADNLDLPKKLSWDELIIDLQNGNITAQTKTATVAADMRPTGLRVDSFSHPNR